MEASSLRERDGGYKSRHDIGGQQGSDHMEARMAYGKSCFWNPCDVIHNLIKEFVDFFYSC